eukprot:CAMPEP_0174344610 /NCGR_PEP_ID=MMETSP0810-20121108/27766_1 /TAXON_ID=73025 ORGANISM="Eutreptiella gymnastica-like, Strain CCMP1594" /NCGR_SAMPLE_ID=MMETSP0810 /ASSEMBLY_ACC=CAM_ASM_000659 /LENGTH=107 /DNA_ID=CAMNT_0015467783 /DNA_START=436 /DNA_END=756 /DNA_ORIENTATION=-
MTAVRDLPPKKECALWPRGCAPRARAQGVTGRRGHWSARAQLSQAFGGQRGPGAVQRSPRRLYSALPGDCLRGSCKSLQEESSGSGMGRSKWVPVSGDIFQLCSAQW